jgi:hypothetical protein
MSTPERHNGNGNGLHENGGFLIPSVVPDRTPPVLKNLERDKGESWMDAVSDKLMSPEVSPGAIARVKKGARQRVNRIRSSD